MHLSREPERERGNHRNGHNRKRVSTESGSMDLAVPRDRLGRFEPQLVERYARRLPGFDDKVISMYARGMTTREIAAHVEEMYGLSVSRELISKVTDSVHEEVQEWQSRPLEPVYAIVYFDAIRVKIRDEGLVRNKAVHLAIGVTCAGRKEVLGMWLEREEGAKFWLSVMNEIKMRGVQDVLIVVVDGLKGFPEAIEAVFPHAVVQTCIVHLIRYSLLHAAWKERKELAAAIRPIYQAPTAAAAEAALGAFEAYVVEREVSGHRQKLAGGVGPRGAVLRLLGGDPAGHLHHQRDREPELDGAPRGAGARPLPQRPGRHQAGVPGAAQRRREVAEPAAVLACRARRARHPLRRPLPARGAVVQGGPVWACLCDIAA